MADDDGGDGLLWLFAEVDHKNALKEGKRRRRRRRKFANCSMAQMGFPGRVGEFL